MKAPSSDHGICARYIVHIVKRLCLRAMIIAIALSLCIMRGSMPHMYSSGFFMIVVLRY